MKIQHEFDQYARSYETLHDENLSMVGADSHEFLLAKLAFCERYVRKHQLPESERKTFLDYGCGTGRLGQVFHDRFDDRWTYVGIDPSEGSVKEAQAAIDGQKAGKPVEYKTLDVWQQEKDSYDFALAACVFHHIAPSARPAALRSVWDRVKGGGTFAIWEHNPWNPVTRRIVNTCPFDKDAILLSLPEMKKMWTNLCVSSLTGYSYVTFFPGRLRLLEPLERLLGWLPLGGQWVFLAKKI